ncbi:Gfo/Idh/MocA family protein [Ruania halotolerans]|uniref:Gfo/Idh/MocA family protein n=1 Tax=Ruania halotolerans TaxID=2897773 RepID=UPI001E2F2FF3|nr:Gfo/Idh/MocA family oxidoreductase [Ruania halotolerans]UFU06444.1 Gfo/Idh/MocA family oxidoreductase [Ruania halotolerans]
MTNSPTTPVARVAVIGCGARAAIATHVASTGAGIVTALVDPDPTARERTAARLAEKPAHFSDAAELLRAGTEITAALVLTPDDTHAEVAIPLLEAGIAVFLEKPITITTADADRVLAAAARSNTPLYVGHNMRHMSVVTTMRDIIGRGEIGDVKAIWCRHFVGHGGDFYFKDWHAERAHGTGLLLQKGAHDIDVIHWLAGAYTTRVTGMGGLTLYDQVTDRRDNSDRTMSDWYSEENWPPLAQRELNPTIDVEDLSMVQMQLESGVYASYQQCHYTPDYWRNYTVIGTEGRLENFGDTAGGVIRVWNRRSGYRPEGDIEYPILGDDDGHGDADLRTIAEFLDFAAHGGTTATSPVAARNAVATAVAATESLRSGSVPREVPPLDPTIASHFDRRALS